MKRHITVRINAIDFVNGNAIRPDLFRKSLETYLLLDSKKKKHHNLGVFLDFHSQYIEDMLLPIFLSFLSFHKVKPYKGLKSFAFWVNPYRNLYLENISIKGEELVKNI